MRSPRSVTCALVGAVVAGGLQLAALSGTSAGAVDPEARLDVVVLGDGYTAADEAAFTADAARVADDLLARTPFAEHRDLVNVVGVFVPSQQRGADQPPPSATCRDHSTAPGCCPETGTANPTGFVETRYDATYCSFGIQRLLVPADTGAVVADADAGHPGWEQVLLVVNDEEYGGSGASWRPPRPTRRAPR